jgi:hypothetical protein
MKKIAFLFGFPLIIVWISLLDLGEIQIKIREIQIKKVFIWIVDPKA